MVKLPCRVETGGAAFLSCVLVLGGTFGLCLEFYLSGAFDIFAEFPALVLGVAFRYHTVSG